MAIRFRLDEALVMGALETGRRLRAKANLAEAQARKLAQDLEALGAIVAVAPHTATGTNRPVGAPPATQPPSDPPRLISASPISPEQVVTFTSFSSSTPSLTLATLDGEEPPEVSAGLPPVEPTPVPGPQGSAPTPRSSAVRDAFRPPSGDESPLELVARPSRPGRIAPMPSIATAHVHSPTVEARSVSAPRLTASGNIAAAASTAPAPAAAEPSGFVAIMTRGARGRLLAGLLLGLLVGFLPAQLYASFAEDKLDEIGAALAREPAPVTESDHAALMQQFDLAAVRLERLRTRTIIVTALVWAVAGAACASGYWRLTSRLA